MRKRKGPLTPAKQIRGPLKYRPDSRADFPYCELYGTRIVGNLPPRCPLKKSHSLTVIDAMRTRAFQELDGGWRCDLQGAVDVLNRCEICSKCAPSMLRHPTVKRLMIDGRAAPCLP